MRKPDVMVFKIEAKYAPVILELMRDVMRVRELTMDERNLRDACEMVEVMMGE